MFKLLKSKLKSWLGKSQEKEIEIKKDKKQAYYTYLERTQLDGILESYALLK